MEKEMMRSVNKLPKGINLLLCVFPLIGLAVMTHSLDNDFYFLYKMGEYISNNGFPVNDILSMHSEMKLVVQQWLCDVLYYRIYEALGTTGMVIFMAIIYIVFVTVYYKLCKLVSDNFFVSIVATTLVGLFISMTYLATRPQIVTYVVFLLLFYVLESYIKTKKVYWLAALPLLSLFLINWHASMWWLLFVFMLPYLVEAVPVHIKSIEQKPCCNIFALLITMVIMFFAGLINPYGIDAVTYLFGSYGVEEINEQIQEMHPTTMNNPNGVLFLVVVFLFVLIFAFSKKKNIKARFFCLTMGTLVLAFSSLKGIAYFEICGFFSMVYFLKDFDFKIKVTNSKRTQKQKVRLGVLVSIFCVMLVGLGFVLANDQPNVNEQKSPLQNLDEIVDVLDEKPKNEVVLFTDFNTGQYLEFNGYKAYIDGRAEVFLKKNNKSYDYFKEFVEVKNGEIYYKDFVNKYNFTYLIVDDTTPTLLEGLKHDEDYQIACENEDYTLFELKR